MSRVDWRPLAERLRSSGSIVLATHVNADGDGIGCEIALYHFLREIGRDPVVVNNERVPDKFRFLKGAEAIEPYGRERHSRLIREADLFLMLDNSSVDRLALLKEDVAASRALTVCIDHHASVNPFWKLNCVDTEACASGELVHELIRCMEGRVSPEIAEALYVAYVTDTGHFRFSKTSPATHRAVADLVEAGGISPSRVYTEIYENTTPAMAALTGMALSSLRFEHGGRFAVMTLTRDQIAGCGGEEEDTGDLVNLGLAVNGVASGALFKELPDGTVKVSLRSKGEIDVYALAVEFSGGGHRNASGILMSVPLESAIRTVVGRMKGLLPDPEAPAGAEERRGR